ncbi:MAG: hydrogenase expression/formation protein HypE [Coriobacteriia bacterium]|nr:hydrogenase expression/formation protein HypE [Coriobacteriia bacterium]
MAYDLDKIELGHGSGGLMMQDLLENLFFKAYGRCEDDAAVCDGIAFSTDSYVVSPKFFPGGDIGKLAVCGTVNDVSTRGCPQFLSISIILEQGYEISKLKTITKSINDAAIEAGVKIVTGDTKVVEKGCVDGIFINTAGIGKGNPNLSGKNCIPGDKILVSGTLGDHGMAIMANRMNIETSLKSDVAPLNNLVQDVLKAAPHTRTFRDPTRGGLASTLNEFAQQSNVDIKIDENKIPVKKEVQSVCDILGFDVLQVANEGKMVAIVPDNEAEAALVAMKKNKYGIDAAIIGECLEPTTNKVVVETQYKTKRILDMLAGSQLPRIC